MNLRKNIARFLMGKNFIHSAIMSDMVSVFGWSPSQNNEELIKKVRGWVYTCINKNASACAQVPLRLYTVKGSAESKEYKTEELAGERKKYLHTKLAERITTKAELVEITDHPIITLLKNVNPSQNAYDLKDITFRYLESIATSYWYLERGVNREIINIYPLLSQKVKIIPNKKIGVNHYEYGSGQGKMVIPLEDMMHFRYTSLTDPFLGDSPLKACEQAADLHNYMNMYEIATFKSGGKPNVVMEVPVDGYLDDPERKRIESDYKRRFGDATKNKSKFMTITGGATLKEFGFSPKEMSFTEGRKTVLEEICGAYGVPIAFVKTQEISRANLWASMDLWAKFTLNPRLVMVEQKLNESFTPNWGDNLYLMFDDARPHDEEYRLKELETHLRTKYSTVNEERAKDGLEPVPWGDKPVEAERIRLDPRGTPETENTEPKKNTNPSDKQNLTVQKAETKNDSLDSMEMIFRTQLTVLFNQVKSEVIKNLQSYGKAYNKLNISDLLASIFDYKKWEKALEDESLPYMKGILTQSIISALEKVDPQAVYNASSPEVLRALDERTGQMKTVIGTTQREIRDMIAEGIENNESRSELIKRIREKFDARGHADRVVRTESIWAHNEGTEQGWKQSGVVAAKRWDTAPDERRCPFCKSMHNVIVDIDREYFSKGDSMTVKDPKTGKDITLGFDYEGVKHPPLHPNCRCEILPILIEN